ncbi:MAG: isopentenyl phosphate kinase [Methanothrix sp.]|jgi:isopentenyl phosphate kinase|uniref:isopentenyl phosphate kinase n=1 Tax=Methanothrix sp. TaxID=90426 RepID=UPI00247DE156|nr:isopentenyl phosphate kinase [Methanothrix sp.]
MLKILKLGGSIITDKSRLATARLDQISRIAHEIAGSEDLIVVHGAGSFGHIHARNFGLPERFTVEGLLKTHLSVSDLNRTVVEALHDAGVDALPVHPLSCVVLRDGRIHLMSTEVITEMLTRSVVPVLHGDVAMDVSRGAGIVSGDQLVAYLARTLGAGMVAMGTDVDGVMINGRVLSCITPESMQFIESHLLPAKGIDVTGGMHGKLSELVELAAIGIDSRIFNAGVSGNVRRALSGEKLGTLITGREHGDGPQEA